MKALFVGFTIFLVSSILMVGVVFAANSAAAQPYLYWVLLVGAVCAFGILSAPAWIILSTPQIFAWIGKAYGIKALAAVATITAMLVTISTCVFIALSIINRSFHAEALTTLISATVVLCGFAYRTMQLAFRRPADADC